MNLNDCQREMRFNFLGGWFAGQVISGLFWLAAMLVVGAHYLPFITLYGMKMFGILAGLLIVFGVGLAFYGPDVFSLGGWITVVLLIVFAFIGRHLVLLEEK